MGLIWLDRAKEQVTPSDQKVAMKRLNIRQNGFFGIWMIICQETSLDGWLEDRKYKMRISDA